MAAFLMSIYGSMKGVALPLPPRSTCWQSGAMAQITNLSQFRKQKARAEKRVAGDANAAKFGRSKAQRATEEAEAEKARRHLDQHRREEDDA